MNPNLSCCGSKPLHRMLLCPIWGKTASKAGRAIRQTRPAPADESKIALAVNHPPDVQVGLSLGQRHPPDPGRTQVPLGPTCQALLF